MTDIQQARDVLAHARAASTIRPWHTDTTWSKRRGREEFDSANVTVDMWDIATFTGGQPDDGREDRARADRALFLLTTHPDLLEALDGLLAAIQAWDDDGSVVLRAEAHRIAAAIITANERMTS